MRSSLRGKLALFAVLAALIPISLISAATYRLARGVLQEKVGYDLLRLTLLIKMKVEDYVSDRVSVLRAIDPESLAGPGGARRLARFGSAHPEFEELTLVGAPGPAGKAGRPSPVLPQKLLEAVLQGGLDAGYAQASPAGSGPPALAILLPIEAARQPGALYARLNLDPLLGEVRAYLVGRTGRIAIIQGDGRPLVESGGATAATPAIMLKALAGETGFAAAPGPQGEAIVAYAPVLEEAGDLHWGLVMSQDRAEALELADKLLKRILAVGLALLLLSTLVSLWIARTISRPILELVRGTEAVAGGELGLEIPVTSSDEAGTLARAFNSMSKALKRRDEVITNYARDISSKNAALEEAARLRDQFFRFLVHELRSPLSIVIGYMEMLIGRPRYGATPEVLGVVKIVLKTGQNMLETVNNLLDIGQLQAGRMSLRAEEFALAGFLGDIHSKYSALASPKGLALDFSPAPDVVISTDRSKLDKILSNIVGNAIKYTEKGRISLEATASEGRIVFRISDTGIGLRPQDKAGLFQEFERIEFNKTVRGQVGTGLGLAFTKKLVEFMEGTVTLDSEFGRGTTFTVSLPAVISGPAQPAQAAGAAAAPAAGPAGTPGRIVAIDDDPAMLDLIKDLLEPEGYEIYTSMDPASGVDLVRSKQPFAVLLDVNLGKTHGISVLQTLKSTPEAAPIPVIFITGSSDPKALEYYPGIVDCLPKPLPTDRLFKHLDSLSQLAKPHATILILDPDADAADSLARSLTSSGFKVLKAARVDDGLRTLREALPQWLFLTTKIGARTCFEILSAVRCDQALKGIKVVLLLSEILSDEDMAEIERQGLRVIPARGSLQETLSNLKDYLRTLYALR